MSSPAGGILSSAHRATTIGILALVSLHAFEALALTTVMPTIATDLDGANLYAMAFTATLAAGIVSIVVAGNLADRRGPRIPLALGLGLFSVGLIVAGLAPTMHVLVGARIVQGLGAGLTSTALYVLVTRAYPPRLHTSVLAGFSAAWVLPSIAGPFVAGLIAEAFGWRWVFGLSQVVLVAAALLLIPPLRSLGHERAEVPWRWRAILCSTGLAAAVLVLNSASERTGWTGTATIAFAVLALILTVRPLLPPGALRAGRGLPTDVLVRALGFAAFSGAEIYLPRLLTERDGFGPALAGLGLTFTGLTWFLGSWIQGRHESRFEVGRTTAAGLGVMTIGLAALAVATAAGVPAWVLIAVFPIVGFGIGTIYPRVTAQALARADSSEQGFVSSALQIGDSAGASTAIAGSAIIFGLVSASTVFGPDATVPAAYVAIFAAMGLPALIGWLVAYRVR